MAIDFKAIKSKFMLIAQEKVGSRLYQENGIPAVIDARTKRERPPYPYITVDLYDVSEDTTAHDYIYIDDANSNLETYENSKTFMLRYRCNGGKASDENIDLPLSILNDLKNALGLRSVLDDLENTVGCSPQYTSSIDNLPIRLATEYIESASFFTLVHVIDTSVDTDTFVINQIDIENNQLYPPEDVVDVSVDLTIITP